MQPTATEERLRGGYAGRMLLAVSVGWAVLQTGRFLLSPLLPTIISDLQITEATAGIALALFQGVYALSQYPGGEYSDRWTRATLIVPGLIVLVVGFLAFGVAWSLPAFVAAAVVVGLGKGLFAIPSRALLSDLFVQRRGRALGVYAAGTDVGGLLSSGLAVLALTYATWRAPFFPVAAVLAFVTVLYVVWSREEYVVGDPSLDVGGTARRLAASPTQRRTLAAFSLFYFMVGGFINFLPTYLATTKGFSQGLASATFAIVFAVGLAVKPVAGGLGDRFSRRGIAVVGISFAALSLAALVVAASAPVVWVSVGLLALGYKTGFPLADAIIMDDAPDGDMGADLGAARALFLGANAVGPAYVGVVVTYANYTAAFGGLVVCLVVAAGLLLWGERNGS
ncbi:Predicted arabinose efflux permease, MFS family [Halopelagius inordinatus]|uniref:Predicted arabinose efflux permease, MFS family n=2 Tax=Halopelagius inordinatus TaxID=553467 RepID=A0A1I2VIX3_9EURY|nr:Predicted arabinose efflux permease, MFS family [Halopelagius inordinatus]